MCTDWRAWDENLSCSWILCKALFLPQIESRAEAGLYSASLRCQVCASCLLEAGSLCSYSYSWVSVFHSFLKWSHFIDFEEEWVLQHLLTA